MAQVLKLHTIDGNTQGDCRIWLLGIVPLWKRHRWGKWELTERVMLNPMMAQKYMMNLEDTRRIKTFLVRSCRRCGFVETTDITY